MSDTKQQLEASKSELESRVATLQTKDGADAFVADKLSRIEAALPQLSPSMQWHAGRVCQRLRTEPEDVVAEEINRLEAKRDAETEVRR